MSVQCFSQQQQGVWVCSVAALLIANQSIQSGTTLTPLRQPIININSMTSADVQIQRIEHEKAQTLAELEPALRRQADLQVKVFSISESRGPSFVPLRQ